MRFALGVVRKSIDDEEMGEDGGGRLKSRTLIGEKLGDTLGVFLRGIFLAGESLL